MSNQGTIVQVIGPVVDVDFSESGKLPAIYEALEINFDVSNTNDCNSIRLDHPSDSMGTILLMHALGTANVVRAVTNCARNSSRFRGCAPAADVPPRVRRF